MNLNLIVGLSVIGFTLYGAYRIVKGVWQFVRGIGSTSCQPVHAVKVAEGNSAARQSRRKPRYIRIGVGRYDEAGQVCTGNMFKNKLVNFDDIAAENRYSGRTWLGGLPVWADVIFPNHWYYPSIIYMDHWFKQFVYDEMASIKLSLDSAKRNVSKFEKVLALIGVAFFGLLSPIGVLSIILCLFAFVLTLGPHVCASERIRGEYFKNHGRDFWYEVHTEVVEGYQREQEIRRAVRSSRWW